MRILVKATRNCPKAILQWGKITIPSVLKKKTFEKFIIILVLHHCDPTQKTGTLPQLKKIVLVPWIH